MGTNDSPGGDLEKRHVVVETQNEDGTVGIYNIFYLHNKTTDVAKFYNAEPEILTNVSNDEKKLKALKNYLAGKYQAYFIGRYDLVNNWAEADVFSLNAQKLEMKSVLVFKKGSNPINDIDVVKL